MTTKTVKRIGTVQRHVSLATAERSGQYFDDMRDAPPRWKDGGRCGTLFCSLEEFAQRLGNPHEAVPVSEWRDYWNKPLLDGAGKISAVWYFDTPRGLLQVSDYWWNPPSQLSIRAADRRAMRWFLRWAAIYAFRANGSNGK